MRWGTSRLLIDSLLGLFLFWFAPASAQAPTPPAAAVVGIVIDDIGNSPRDGRRAIALPGPVAVAVLPHTAYGAALAEEAQRAGKEVLLHLPMDADGETETDPGPGRIEAQMSAREIAAMLAYDLETVPNAVGVNNHMGSRLTQNAAIMGVLMQSIHTRGGLFFLDSRTSPRSIAARSAAEHGVPALERDVFLDNDRGEDAVWSSIRRIERLLTVRGHAIAIGHPYPETFTVLERWLPMLAARGIRVVPLAVLLKRQKGKTKGAEMETRPLHP
jgi:polysaccharide deacetylase 2 family uncharacterized protein YibQ